MLLLQWKKSHFKDSLMNDTFHCKWYCTWRGSQNKGFLLLKTAQNPLSKVKFLFQKDQLIYRHAILDTVSIHLAQQRYKRWPPLNRVKINLILYILCATAVYLQYLIPTCCTMFIYASHTFELQFFGHHLPASCSFDVCSLYVLVGKPEGKKPLGRPRHR